MTPPELVLMGRASGAFGVKGEIRISYYGQDPEVLSRAGVVFLGPNPQALRPLTPTSQRVHAGRVLLTTREVTSREEAAALSGAGLYVPRAALAPLAQGEYYWFQLKDALVRTRQGADLGRVAQVANLGPHDLLLVRAPDGKEALVPVVDSLVVEMDLRAGVITVDLPEGLLESQGWGGPPEPAGADDL